MPPRNSRVTPFPPPPWGSEGLPEPVDRMPCDRAGPFGGTVLGRGEAERIAPALPNGQQDALILAHTRLASRKEETEMKKLVLISSLVALAALSACGKTEAPAPVAAPAADAASAAASAAQSAGTAAANAASSAMSTASGALSAAGDAAADAAAKAAAAASDAAAAAAAAAASAASAMKQ